MELFSFMRRSPRRCVWCNPINDASVLSDALRLSFIVFTLLLFATIPACSREDIAGSSSVPTSLSANTALMDLGQRDGQRGTNETALLVESESSASNRRGSVTGIASYYADTDGDIAPDFVKVCDRNTLCIKHPSSLKTAYNHPLWAALSFVAVQGSDGEPRTEIIVLA